MPVISGWAWPRKFDPMQFSLLLLDETESFLAPEAAKVVEYYRQNPNIKVVGVSATPMRMDGIAMKNLFSHVAVDRDILWGIESGWLVPARQAFVSVNLDFSSLKVRKNEEGEKDYSESDLASMLEGESTLIELAKGIIAACGDRKSIVVCPDVKSAIATAHYLESEKNRCARAIYGTMSEEERERLFTDHRNGQFQYLVSCQLLCKGYDDPTIRAVVNCRKTKSRRLYQQIIGRGVRTLADCVDGVALPDERITAISASAKPNCLIVNMVGLDASVHDITLVDILGEKKSEAARERAKRNMLEDMDGEHDAEGELMEAEDALRKEKEAADALEEKRRLMEEQRRKRKAFQLNADVDVTESDMDWRRGAGTTPTYNLPNKQVTIFLKAKMKPEEISALSPEGAKQLSQQIVYRWKQKLCSYRQAKCLAKFRFTKEELHSMTFDEASDNITKIKANGWRRP